MKIWYQQLDHLNIISIIWLVKNSQSNIKIKSFKMLLFCKTCKLISLKKKLSKISMKKSHQHDKFLYINIRNDEEIHRNSDELIFSFQECKYFVLVTDDVTRQWWVFFVNIKSEIYNVIVYIVNHLETQKIHVAFIHSDWVLEIDTVKLTIFLFRKKTKWKLSTSHS